MTDSPVVTISGAQQAVTVTVTGPATTVTIVPGGPPAVVVMALSSDGQQVTWDPAPPQPYGPPPPEIISATL